MSVGINLLIQELQNLGYSNVHVAVDSTGLSYAVLPNFKIPAGTFAGREIELAIPAPQDYPRSVGASMHILADPPLAPKGNIIVGGVTKRNIIDSNLGVQWQYWSYQFKARPSSPALELISQIHGIFQAN